MGWYRVKNKVKFKNATGVGWYCTKCNTYIDCKQHTEEFPIYDKKTFKTLRRMEKKVLISFCLCGEHTDSFDPDFYRKRHQKNWKRVFYVD